MAFMVTTCTFPALSSLQEVASSDYQNQVHVDMNNIIMPLEYIHVYAIFKLFSLYSSDYYGIHIFVWKFFSSTVYYNEHNIVK